MSARAFRAYTKSTTDEAAAEAYASTGHLSVDADGTSRACFCTVYTEHDRLSGRPLTLEQIADRKRAAR